ncbi:adenosylcobinamide-GDP ribazoletransferase [Rhodococcus sp. G-MC3]|uniref:adenosylcobinamide-GDP ribazoletransferase n=1 Tax=Rhodococcus sp. G-MC3 TaxID=3046209 RepID=UPI0024B9D101|nr:adenosylcobinamide-GDP ribazoletransferase [Rhodococcus sp. G-MC3]MDJ0393033.1 adenosylcobinamide-GDP ribazoletransferase [Rhodococcus sp. G-MC3]
MLVGPRLALSWLTVLPVRGPHDIGRREAGRAITSTPIVGVLLGTLSTLLLWVSQTLSLDGILAGFLTVGALALMTRGMHVDGLADTADGLGCYGPPERAREVMQSGSAGPFGIAAITVVLAVQATAFGALADEHAWVSILLAVTAGRVAVVVACRRGISAASERGFGALVAGTQSPLIVAFWSVAAVAASLAAVNSRWWQGPIVMAVALGAGALIVHHCCSRFGGMSGDVLGAAVEVTTSIVVVGLLLGG